MDLRNDGSLNLFCPADIGKEFVMSNIGYPPPSMGVKYRETNNRERRY